MGKLIKRFKARRNGKREVFSALIDTGADVTNLNLETACELGLDQTTAPQRKMTTAGDVTLIGYELDGVELTIGKRSAKIDVFVPTEVQVKVDGRVHVEPVKRDDEQLIGHDFLQASGSKLDYVNHELRDAGKERGMSAHYRGPLTPVTPAQRARLNAKAICPIPRRKRKKL